MIERIIHQFWFPIVFPRMPRDWLRHSRSWQRWHPAYRHVLWGPEEGRQFVAAHHPRFLRTYDGYAQPIQRIDALRVLVLQHFGGVCADLDLECLRGVEPLLEEQQVVLAAAPTRNALPWRQRGYGTVLSTAFLASAAGHPFWSEVVAELERSSQRPEVLESTGALLVSRCYERSPERLRMMVLSPEHVSPFDEVECRSHTALDLEAWVRRTRDAYAVHHWAGSWSHGAEAWKAATRPRPLGLEVRIRHPELHREGADRLLGGGPLVSCLMVSRGGTEPARWALECFRRQTYRDRELVIVSADPGGGLAEHVRTLNDPRIRLIGAPPQEARSGALRNLALDHARGELVAAWEEDDLSGADRLATQVTALVTAGAPAALLERVTVWRPLRQEVLLSPRRAWATTLVARRAALPRFRESDGDEAGLGIEQLCAQHSHVLVDDPDLHVRVAGGADDPGCTPQASTFRAEGLEYERALSVLDKHVPVLEYLDWLQQRDPRSLAPSPSSAAQLDAPSPRPAGSETSTASRLVSRPPTQLAGIEPPLRLLFAWELGGGLGHTVPLAQLAVPLLEAGHEVHLALLDLSTARAGIGELVRHPRLHVWQAPCWPAPLVGHVDSANYAELLYRAGYLDPGRLSGLVDGWEALFRTLRPELLLADHAPTALLTARGHDFRRAMVGTGFFDPVPGSPMPTFREWEGVPRARLEEAERVVLATCNTILGSRAYPPLRDLQDLLNVDEHFLLTVPELDHFERRARDPGQRYYGMLSPASQGRPVTWPRGAGPAVFAYVKGEYGPITKVLEALRASPWRVLAFVPGCSPSVAGAMASERMSIVSEPVDMAEVCRSCDVVVCHSGSGTTMTALMNGKPLLMLPMHLEQYMVGRRIQSMGAGLVALEDQIGQLPDLLRRILEQQRFREAAEAFSRRHASLRSSPVADLVAARCVELALATRASRAQRSRA